MLAAFWMPPVSDRRLTLAALNILVVALMLERMTALLGSSVVTSKILLFLGIAMVAQVVTATGNILMLNALSSRTCVKIPDVLHRVLSGKVAGFLCLCDQEPETLASSGRSATPHRHSTTFATEGDAGFVWHKLLTGCSSSCSDSRLSAFWHEPSIRSEDGSNTGCANMKPCEL
ncbi:hypothetical protein MTO96_036845 [Rhipicephalus appendiculatus]